MEGLVIGQGGDGTFWRDRRIFLTGHTGFKGSWLALALQAWGGAKVFGFALPPPEEGVFESAKVAATLAGSTYGDVRSLQSIQSALAASEAEVVIHMAAQPLVRFSYEDPVGTYATNVMGTVHLLEAVRLQPSVKAVVVVTSDKCYENREWLWGYREDEPMGGYDPYSNSKGCAELVASAYRRSFMSAGRGARVGSGRAGNVIGGGDWSGDRLVPDLMRSIRAGDQTVIRYPHAVRPWQHVLDPVMGYIMLAERLLSARGEDYAQGWNFGPDASSERTVEQVMATACDAWGEGATWRLDGGEHAHEAGYLKLDSSKARRLLNWTPVWDFKTAVERTVAWYQAEASQLDMREFTLGQISEYLAARAAFEGVSGGQF
ncbi:MAG: CDP-glucose 4,6-dehydratase [Caulobacteraceae bacterium]